MKIPFDVYRLIKMTSSRPTVSDKVQVIKVCQIRIVDIRCHQTEH